MKIKLVMLYDRHRDRLADISVPVAEAYARRHGYDFVCYQDLLDPRYNGAWNKLLAVSAQISDRNCPADWIIWLDADVLVTRQDIKVEDMIQKFNWGRSWLISADRWGICTGVFAIKCDAWAKTVLEAMPVLGTPGVGGPIDKLDWGEQNTVKSLMEYFPDFRSHIGILPEWLITNPNSALWPDSWMRHFWAAFRDREEVRKEMQQCLMEGSSFLQK